jgi:hypothetical protein
MMPEVVSCSLEASRFHLSPACGGADRNRPVDGGPGSNVAALWCRLRRCIAVIRRRGSCFVPSVAQHMSVEISRHKPFPCEVKVNGDTPRVDSSPALRRGAPRPTILKRMIFRCN